MAHKHMAVAPHAMASEEAPMWPSKAWMTESGALVIRAVGKVVARATYKDMYDPVMVSDHIASLVAMNEPKGVILDIASSGGDVEGMFEAAGAIRSLDIPTVAVIRDHALSAAYLYAAACDKIYISETGSAGSIGIVSAISNVYERDKKEGVKWEIISTGKLKAAGNPHLEDIDPDYLAMVASENQYLADIFYRDVAAYRRIDIKDIQSMQGAVYMQPDAIRLGLADEIGGLDDAESYIISQHKEVSTVTEDEARQLIINTISEQKGAIVSEAKVTAAAIARECDAAGYGYLAAAAIERGDELQTVKNAIASAREISALCQVAGHPEMARGLIEAGADVATASARISAAQPPKDTDIDTSHADQSASGADAWSLFDDKIKRY